MKVYKTQRSAERAAVSNNRVARLAIPIRICEAQHPKGGANKWAYGAFVHHAEIRLGDSRRILASTARVLTWRSGNYSSIGQRIVDNFASLWSDKWVVISPLEMAPKMYAELMG